MKMLYKTLTDYAIHKDIIEETDREIYEYAFETAAEVGLFVMASVLIALYLHMFAEGMLFFIVFTPLRSYAGGLHLEKYHSCFFLSCLTFCGILLAVKYICISIYFSLMAFFMLEIFVYSLYPVENVNREVDKEENLYFKKKLKRFLLLDLFIGVICFLCKNERCLFLIMSTFLMVVITMMAGKCKNKIMLET